FQAEDGIRDKLVTGVQTCALPILADLGGSAGSGESNEPGRPALLGESGGTGRADRPDGGWALRRDGDDWLLQAGPEQARLRDSQIGRASCRERGEIAVGRARLEQT